MAYALAGSAESVHIAVFQVCTRPVRAIVATPWRFAFTLSTTTLAVPAAREVIGARIDGEGERGIVATDDSGNLVLLRAGNQR